MYNAQIKSVMAIMSFMDAPVYFTRKCGHLCPMNTFFHVPLQMRK